MKNLQRERPLSFDPEDEKSLQENIADTAPGREQFSETEQKEREAAIQEIESRVDEWIEAHIPEGEEFDQDRIAELVRYLGREHKSMLERISGKFADREMYIDRPAVRVYEGKDGKAPDLYLLGWRDSEQGVEATGFHDHEDSEAAVYVLDGEVREVVCAFDEKEWEEDRSRLRGVRFAERGLGEGSTLKIGAPYIHDVLGKEGQDCAVTFHGYYPPLDEMTFFEEDSRDLKRSGDWREERREEE